MLGGQVSEGDFVIYGAGTYMLVSRIERLTGEAYTGARYSFDEDLVVTRTSWWANTLSSAT